ncbi:MAG: sulfotransferase domain-containing protein [Cellvibrionaceae bacterium]
MVKQFLRRAEFELSKQGDKFSPDTEDVMLVSYPKSGNTWIRALVAHLVRPQASLVDMERLVPDVYKSTGKVLRKAYRFPCGGRLIKSHQSFRPDYKRVVYITRDPRAVCVSYYHYLRGVRGDRDIAEMSLDDFVLRFLSGDVDRYGTWAENVGSWECAERADMLHLCYEEMKSDPVANLRKICEFVGLNCNQESISSAVTECSIENLRKKEEREGLKWAAREDRELAALFFRNGSSSSWAELSPFALEQIYKKWGSQMLKRGYRIES